MIERLLPIIAGLSLLAAPAMAAPAPTFAERLQAIDAIGRAEVASGRTPGLVIGVMKDGKTVFVRGYGSANLETGTPAAPETVFRVGSITKQFTAASVQILAEEGKLSLEDKLSKYFPDFYRGDEVTLRQMLNHTAGLTNYTEKRRGPNDFRADLTTAEMVGVIRGAYPPYNFSPGAGWHYSNSGFFIAGAIVEKVSGQPLADFMRARIFEPLGMAHTAIDANSEVVAHRASGYEPISGKPGAFRNANFVSMTVPGGAGAMRSTAADLLLWTDALLGGRVVPAARLQEVLTQGRLADGRPSSSVMPPKPGAPPSEYGLGLELSGAGAPVRVRHGGHIDGFNAMLATAPQEHLSWVVLENMGAGTASKVSAAVDHALLH